MLRQTGSKTCIFVLAFAALVVAKPPPPPTPSPWASFGKPGPAYGGPGMGSISVPYMPKSSPFFPKFVDPKAMISTKTDMLSKMFGGLGPFDYTGAGVGGFSPYPAGFPQTAPVLYAINPADDVQANGVAEDVVGNEKMKRGAFGPGGPKYGAPKASPFSPVGPNIAPFSPFGPQISPFSPFGPKISPFAPAFAPGFPFAGFPSKFGSGMYDPSATSTRRRRSIVAEDESSKALGPPPAYPGLAPIAEEPESFASKLLKLYDPAAAPKLTVPGMFGPFGPFGPFAMPPPVTEIPIPKSTIVPPDFWLPTSIIPGPGEYTDKVSKFLSKLFDSLALNKTLVADDGTGKPLAARALPEDNLPEKTLVSRSIEDVKSIAAAKDAIVESILSELGDLKTGMITTLNDFILYKQTAPLAPGAKKPKPVSPWAAYFAPPTPDPTLPFKQRMAVLSQVFDMLTGLQKNITTAVQEAMKASTDAPSLQDASDALPAKYNFPAGNAGVYSAPVAKLDPLAELNATLFDAIKTRLANLDSALGSGLNKPVAASVYQVPAKRDVEDEDYEIPENYDNRHDHDRDQYKRAVQMQMHQGYQSMPPGAIESVQAGGGVVPGHQGGGIKLLNSQNDEDSNKWSEFAEYYKNQYGGRNHHHNHH